MRHVYLGGLFVIGLALIALSLGGCVVEPLGGGYGHGGHGYGWHHG